MVPAGEEQGSQARTPTHADAQGAAPVLRQASQAGQADDQPAASLSAVADGTEPQPQAGAPEPEQARSWDAEAPGGRWPGGVPSLRDVCLGLLGSVALAIAGRRSLLPADLRFEEAWQVTDTAGAAPGDDSAVAPELRDTVRASSTSAF